MSSAELILPNAVSKAVTRAARAVRSELYARFENASENDVDELDFFMDLLDTGFTLEDIKENLPDRYEYSKAFLEDHGLI